MTPTECAHLARMVRAMCPQQKFDEFTVDAWTPLLADTRLADAASAVQALGARQVFIAPSEILAEVRRIRDERLDRTPIPIPPLGMTVAEELVWRRRAIRAIADGDTPLAVTS